jgi:ribosomal protein S18 acetylase RimI-like enzyme
MLIELAEKFVESLSNELKALPESDKEYFHPHKFDIESVKDLPSEKGNHYYIYLDELGEFAGYGMLRTFGRYEIPTLGCVVWARYRGCGNGKRLLEELIEKAKEIKYNKIRLKVYSSNKIAYNLYKEAGFKRIGNSEDGQIWMEYNCKKGHIK